VNIGGMPVILPRPFHDKKKQMAFENQQNLKFDDQGGNGAPPSGCGKLGCANIEMGQPGFPRSTCT
jgi:hypothetical protein